MNEKAARPRCWNTLRQIGLTVVLLAGTGVFLFWVNESTPLQHWLLFRYATYWTLAVGLLASWLLAGNALLTLLAPTRLSLGERVVLSGAVGALAFGLLWFLLGLVGAFSGYSFALLPLSLIAFGARPGRRSFMRYWRHRKLWRANARKAPLWFAGPLVVFGVVSLALLYTAILTPTNVAYDARWYHMAAAETYAVQGGIRRFAEGWFVGAYPQFATWLYAWAFSLPGVQLFDRVELAQHVEFVTFLFSVFSIPVLVRRILGQGNYWLSWVSRFVFPGVFLYDSNLAGAADHIAALWAAPVFLCLLRAHRSLDGRECVLLSSSMAGALLTKYSVVGMIAFPAAAILVRAAVLTGRGLRSTRPRAQPTAEPLLNVGILGALGLLLTTPHWLKNWVWYGDPVYPLGYKWFASRPWTVDTVDRFGQFVPAEWSAPRSIEGALATLQALVTFSFIPNDWPSFHGKVPVFGSLFTLALPCLLFLPWKRRLVALFACTHVAIAVWYWTYHQDRYLQSYVPWMAVCVTCVFIQAWKTGLLPRLAVVAVAMAQLAWGSDVPFIPGHSMAGGTPYEPAIDLLSSSYRGNFEKRLRTYPPMDEVRSVVGPSATVLLHEEHLHLGIGVPTVRDAVAWQGGISYVREARPSQMHALLSRLGVTHALWGPTSHGHGSVGGDVVFYYFMSRYTTPVASIGGLTLSRVQVEPPSDREFANEVLFLGCADTYGSGLYRITDLDVTVLTVPRPASDFPPPRMVVSPETALDQLLGRVDAVLHNPQCFAVGSSPADFGLTQVAHRHDYALWVRSAEAPPAAGPK